MPKDERADRIVADEPVSMLDVSVRACILNLLRRARDELGLAVIYISHDLALIRTVCEGTAVMYRGRVVETGPIAALIASPLSDPPPSEAGCNLRNRCPAAFARCERDFPVLRPTDPARTVAWHLGDSP